MADQNDIEKAQTKKRDRAGWTLDEIKKNAQTELKKFKQIAKHEPSDLSSGDMGKIIHGEDDGEDEGEDDDEDDDENDKK